jgi:hypothetical protein
VDEYVDEDVDGGVRAAGDVGEDAIARPSRGEEGGGSGRVVGLRGALFGAVAVAVAVARVVTLGATGGGRFAMKREERHRHMDTHTYIDTQRHRER